jgi:hypothetical protein
MAAPEVRDRGAVGGDQAADQHRAKGEPGVRRPCGPGMPAPNRSAEQAAGAGFRAHGARADDTEVD